MATVKFRLKSSSNPAKIYCRFIHGRAIDIETPLSLLVNPAFWDKKQQKIKNVIQVRNRDEINRKLALLQVDIFDNFNFDYSEGEIIDKFWLSKKVDAFFNRPTGEVKNINKDHLIYYTDFASWWIKEKSDSWIIGPNKFMGDKQKGPYENFICLVKEFEGKEKLKLRNITNNDITNFVNHLIDNLYSPKTAKRHIARFKFFMARAEETNININKTYKQRVFVPEEETIKEPFFNPDEIEKIFNHDFSDNERLDNVRDNLIIACWTGLRVSDFLTNLDISNFIDDYIEIKTQKTKTPVVIPIHPMVKDILIKRKGKLPKKISDQKFNVYVKEVCEEVGFKSLMKGKLYNKEKKRDEAGVYKKYLLISSHIGRRSFATNHYGKIADSVIMGVCGWKTKDMMLNYIQTSNREHAVELKKYWEEIYN